MTLICMWICTWIYLERCLSHAHTNIIYTDINTHKSTKEPFYFLTSWRTSKISFLVYFTRNLLQYCPSHMKCLIRSICTFPATHPSWAELLPWLGQEQQLRPQPRLHLRVMTAAKAGWRRMCVRGRQGFGEIMAVIVPRYCSYRV